MTAAATPGREALLQGLIQDAISVLHHDTTEGSDVDKYERECLRKKFSTRLAAKPAEGMVDERLSIIVGVKSVLEFAIGLAWDAERLIPDSEPKRLRDILNNIRQGYLKPAVERLKAVSPSTTGEPKR